MDHERNHDALNELRPELLVFCGAVGALGNIAPLAAMLMAMAFAEHDFMADTISDLGRGPHKWIMDTGFYLGATGMLALSIGTAHYHIGRFWWSLGVFVLALLALVITLLGLWDDLTAQGDNWTVHVWLTFLLGPLYLAGPLVMAGAIARISAALRGAFIASAILWIVFATGFKLAPDSYDGALEKIAVAATLIWTLPLAWILWRQGRNSLS
ncbi:DUF998 domain-containing protein [Tateyamaria omphalii]|uniref:DUF998 domain-containing protein n=1 Tax=Tateyamaria omphalii TaxID=299262 RepID=A0A1P8MRD9_9RHOB|nr:DUF998 domain-containing protein [Tateyamaria omphalii]APX10553.1 hypothetical protein BWR18_01705 [Tateyamaria omphalii]